MALKVFILGRPGSGKSTAFRHIKKYIEEQFLDWSSIRFNDYDILREMFLFEKLFQTDMKLRKFRATEHGGFDVLDFSVLDTALKELEKKVRHRYSPKRDELIAIEFARDDYVKALQQFSSAFLKDAYFLLIETNMETCVQRVHDRVAHPMTIDDYFVSDDILTSYYNNQHLPSNLKIFGIDAQRVEVIDNRGTYQNFTKKVNQFVDFIIEEEDYLLASERLKRNSPKFHTRFFSFASGSKVRIPFEIPLIRQVGTGSR